MIEIDNQVITTPIVDILHSIKKELHNGKLSTIEVRGTDISVTCPNDNHKGGRENSPDCHIYIGESTQDLKCGTFHCFACHESGDFVREKPRRTVDLGNIDLSPFAYDPLKYAKNKVKENEN